MKKIVLLILFSFLILPMTTSFATVNEVRNEKVDEKRTEAVQNQVFETQKEICINSTFELDDYDLQLLRQDRNLDMLLVPAQKEIILVPLNKFDLFRSDYFSEINGNHKSKRAANLFQKDIVLPLSRYRPFHVS